MILKFLVLFILFNILIASPITPSGSRDNKNAKPSTSSTSSNNFFYGSAPQEQPLDLSTKNRYNYGNTPSTSGTRQKTFDCSECDKRYGSRKALIDHDRYVHEGKKETCKKCNQIFDSHSRLQYHMQTHHTENICDKCNRKFSTKQCLRDHHRAEHEENSSIYKCEKCPFQTNHRSTYCAHKNRNH